MCLEKNEIVCLSSPMGKNKCAGECHRNFEGQLVHYFFPRFRATTIVFNIVHRITIRIG